MVVAREIGDVIKNTSVGIDPSSNFIEPFHKGLGAMREQLSSQEISRRQWNLLREDLSLPTAVLYAEKLRHNVHWMQDFSQAYGVKLAPHGKTSMAPALFAMQLNAGAWGITLATVQQTAVAYQNGVRRVLMANQLVGKQNMLMVSWLLRDPGFDYFCLVDSAENVRQLGEFFRSEGRRLQVLLELGMDGGRTGVRDEQQLHSVLAELAQWRDHIVLSGVEIYEGISDDESAIQEFLQRAVDVARKLAGEDEFARTPIILSGAGSAWYDLVVETFTKAELNAAFDIVLRPGCYLTHDVGSYRIAQEKIKQRNSIAHQMQSSLVPALQLWAYVQSVPEKKKAIIGLGKRDAAIDAGLPTPAQHVKRGSMTPNAAPAHWKLIRMMDQHAYLQIAEGDEIGVGDMIGFDISHPCTTFDKWRCLPLLDADYRVIDVIRTYF